MRSKCQRTPAGLVSTSIWTEQGKVSAPHRLQGDEVSLCDGRGERSSRGVEEKTVGEGDTEKTSHVGFTEVQQVECLQLHIITKIVDIGE